jgi:hypothetical protein
VNRSPRPRRPLYLRALPGLFALAGCVGAGPGAGAQEVERCAPVERFLVADMGLQAVTHPDTIDDWRTRQIVPGCRVTAAGSLAGSLQREAEQFYDRLRHAGWSRTPDPIDAPGESALRMRLDQTDCFFQIYSGMLLMTPAEMEVMTRAMPRPGDPVWNLLVQCMPAMEAAPR